MFKLNNTYKKVKDIFVKPKLRFYFGPWRKEPNLPVSHRGPLIRLFPKHHTLYKWDKDFKEKHPIFTKYFKPCYELPIWLTFDIFNRDIWWKTKWGDYRFEYPGQFTIVFFGLSFSVWNSPQSNAFNSFNVFTISVCNGDASFTVVFNFLSASLIALSISVEIPT